MKNRKNIIMCTVIILIVLLTVLLFVFLKAENKNKSSLFLEDDLIEDYYVIDDYEKDLVYENKIYVPNFMTRTNQLLTMASYSYIDDYYSLSLIYNTYKTKDELNKKFISGEKYKKKDFYYYLDEGKYVKIYFKNKYNYYQTIEIRIYSMRSDDKEYMIDNSYENLLKNLTTIKKDVSDYSIKHEDGYYVGTIKNNFYVNESNKIFVKGDYKVLSGKYGSNYDSNLKYQNLYLDNSRVSFYEGEITTDIASVKKQTRIEAYFTRIYDLNIKDDAVRDLQYVLNQTAFKDVTEDMVRIGVSSFKYEAKEVKYYKIISDNNGYNERIRAFLPVTDNIYYVVQIYGGDNKKLDLNMIKEFLPINIEVN